MRCVRCLRDSASKVADAPDGTKAWEVFYCSDCNYVWRSSEDEEITNPEKRDPWAQLGKVKDFDKELFTFTYVTQKEK
ncbi:MAG TPA: non-oxidative hydroxyarylic acid decarboxylases subunit D [Syntrophomonadaceae bacterium]|nr:non-oxidative hydroxyarylic acid decarboxylases subunit D [Syntrophomonadaceae bacterium]